MTSTWKKPPAKFKKTVKGPGFTAEIGWEDHNKPATTAGAAWSITGTYKGGSGAIGDHIAKIDSRFKIFAELHLADFLTGVPMYAMENGAYLTNKVLGKENEKGVALATMQAAGLAKIEKYWGVKFSDEQAGRFNSAVESSFAVSDLRTWLECDGSKQTDYVKIALTEIFKEMLPVWEEKARRAFALLMETPEDIRPAIDDEEEAMTFTVDGDTCRITEYRWEKDGDYYEITVDDGTEWRVFRDEEDAGNAAREYWADMAENDKENFIEMVGKETLVSWCLGEMAGPGSIKVSSLEAWLDLYLDDPGRGEHHARYDSEEREAKISASFQDETGFDKNVIAYRIG